MMLPRSHSFSVLLAFTTGLSVGLLGSFVLFTVRNPWNWEQEMCVCSATVQCDSTAASTKAAATVGPSTTAAASTTTADASADGGRVRIFCWIMTAEANHRTKADHVRDTWAKRCDKFLFVSSKDDPSLPSIALKFKTGYKHLWSKTKAAFAHLYKKHLNDADFFLKTDDDTYVIVDNLRRMLRGVNASQPLLIGRRFRALVKQGFMSGGAGYVLSRGAVQLFVERGINGSDNRACPKDDTGPEDVNIGLCLESLGVKILDSIDEMGRERFHPYQPELHLHPRGFERKHWLWGYSYFPLKLGPDCCSDTSVSFHYVSPGQIRAMDFLIYRLQHDSSEERHRIGVALKP